MQIYQYSSPLEVAQKSADRVTTCLQKHEAPVLLLPAGNTPVLLYRELCARQKRGELELERAHLFQLDELCDVPPDDPRSFQYFLRAQLVEPMGLPAERLHFLNGEAYPPKQEIARHAAKLAQLGDSELTLLGIAANGHVAFNEPGSGLSDKARVVELADATVAGLSEDFDSDELPSHGITLGIAELFSSEEIVLLATGASKAEAVARLMNHRPASSFPASLLGLHSEFSVFVDAEAGSYV